MAEATLTELQALIDASRQELRSQAGSSVALSELLDELDGLEASLRAGQLTREALQSAHLAFLNSAFSSRILPSRGYIPASDGLETTRRLVQELENHRVRLDPEQRRS